MSFFHATGAPTHELTRSVGALRVGELAEASRLFLAHFEHRHALPMPEHWIPTGRPDLGQPAAWQGGVLPEVKFQSFRLDRGVGSFHPAHRAKWTAHELLHGLVGFAWKPGASTLWLATAARLAELLPVALWYFFDEVGLHRCPNHAETGPLFGATCRDCEVLGQQPTAPQPRDTYWRDAGMRYVEAELAAVAKSLRLGRVVPHRHATLELASDGLAYAAAHQHRLASPEFARFMDTFGSKSFGWHATLDSLEARVVGLLDLFDEDGAAQERWPERRWPAPHRNTWIARDVAWRLFTVLSETSGDCRAELDDLLALVAATSSDSTDVGLKRVVDTYVALAEAWELPAPDALFAVGYPLPGGLGRSLMQCAEGVASALPATWTALGSDGMDAVAAWLPDDTYQRVPIGRRFAAWLAQHAEPWLAEQATFEAAVAHAEVADTAEITLGAQAADDAGWQLAQGVELIRTRHEVELDPDTVAERGIEALDDPLHLAICRDAAGDLQIAELPGEVFRALERQDGIATLTDAQVTELASAGLLRPDAWHVD